MTTQRFRGYNATAEHEFTSLEKVLLCIANEAIACLKVLKRHLSDFDNRHGNLFTNTAASYLRKDLRTAKDTALKLKHVAHQMKHNLQLAEAATDSARTVMGVIAKAMDVLKTTAHQYDEEIMRQSKKSNADEKYHTSRSCEIRDQRRDDRHCGPLHGSNSTTSNDVAIGGSTAALLEFTDTVEQLVKTILRDNFNISALSHQITIAEKSLSSSSAAVERVKMVVQDVEEKLGGGTPSAESGCCA